MLFNDLSEQFCHAESLLFNERVNGIVEFGQHKLLGLTQVDLRCICVFWIVYCVGVELELVVVEIEKW